MKKDMRGVFLKLVVVGTVLMVLSYLFVFPGATHQDEFVACTASCEKKKMLGKLVKRDGPASPKPSAQKFDCVCS